MKNKSELNTLEFVSQDVSVKVEGKSEIFGGVDLQVAAAKQLLSFIDFKFAQEHAGMDYPQKAHIQLINAIGSTIKDQGYYPDELSNLEVVQGFLNWFLDDAKLHQTEEYVELLKEDEDEEFEI